MTKLQQAITLCTDNEFVVRYVGTTPPPPFIIVDDTAARRFNSVEELHAFYLTVTDLEPFNGEHVTFTVMDGSDLPF